jgi:hypothetical protein
VDGEATRRLRQGQRLPQAAGDEETPLARVYGPGGDFVGIVSTSGIAWKPEKIFVEENDLYS